jgi:hypothetical protein
VLDTKKKCKLLYAFFIDSFQMSCQKNTFRIREKFKFYHINTRYPYGMNSFLTYNDLLNGKFSNT